MSTSAESKLWLVTIDEKDWDYDNFESCVVWADTPAAAEEQVRAALRNPDHQDDPIRAGVLWIENPEWQLHVTEAPTSGIPLVHWHAG